MNLPAEPPGDRITIKMMGIVNSRLAIYEKEHGHYPTQDSGLSALRAKLPHDGWDNEFRYRSLNDNLSYELRSAGPDEIFDTADDIVTNPEKEAV